MKATIFNIEHLSLVDGPGVRTVVFFKGCSLACRWCHNPESISAKPQILIYDEKCIGCGACYEGCPTGAHKVVDGKHVVDASLCKLCGRCVTECFAHALEMVGESVDTEYILGVIQKDIPYYATEAGGGVTFSGGECTLQREALLAILKGCKAMGVHTAVDTCGNVPWETLEALMPYTDVFLYDIKAMDPEIHRYCTGVSNERILENFEKLHAAGAGLIVRVPYMPGFNDGDLPAIAEYLAGFKDVKAELLPYHKLGLSKYEALRQTPADITPPEDALMQALKERYGFI